MLDVPVDIGTFKQPLSENGDKILGGTLLTPDIYVLKWLERLKNGKNAWQKVGKNGSDWTAGALPGPPLL